MASVCCVCFVRLEIGVGVLVGVLRGIGPARAGKLGGGMDFSRCARRGRVIASSACSGPVRLPLGDVRRDAAGFLGTGSCGRIADWGQAVLGGWA